MAINTKNVYLDRNLDPGSVPSGHTVGSTAAAIGTAKITETVTFGIACSASVNANKATAFDDLVKTELVAAIDAYITAASGLNMNPANTIDYNARVVSIALGTADTDMYLPDATKQFMVTVVLSVASA
ncbi:MAG: hypothetical protein RIC30_09380 [Marinoscillum sp.]|uniref:hypothetical protein n=1 Tax=Marinoscillum sp. TaxID=2024838 RepID=UPI0032FA57C1